MDYAKHVRWNGTPLVARRAGAVKVARHFKLTRALAARDAATISAALARAAAA